MTADQWHILGGGSVGCLVAGYLQLAGRGPQLILRDETSIALARRSGITLRIDGLAHEIVGRPDDPASPTHGELHLTAPSVLATQVDRLFICTKAQHALEAVAAIAHRLGPAPLMVLMQNGMGVREALLERWPNATILHGIITEGVYQQPRFALVHAGRGETLVGSSAEPMQAAREWPLAQQVAALLSGAGLAARPVPDCLSRLWQKLAVNCVLNPLTALYRCHNGDLLTRADAQPWIDGICAETAAVAAAAGMDLTAQQLRDIFVSVARTTAANRSSMLQDVEAGRDTEIDFINGYVVGLAARLGIDVPLHRRLVAAVRETRAGNLNLTSPEPNA